MAKDGGGENVNFLGMKIPAGLVFTGIGILAAMAVKGWVYDNEIATKPWVSKGLEEVTVQAKEREKTILDKAIDHSDRNHDDMVSRMKDLSSDQKAQGVKLDLMLEAVNRIQSEKKK